MQPAALAGGSPHFPQNTAYFSRFFVGKTANCSTTLQQMPTTKHARRLRAVARQLSVRDARAAAAGDSSLAMAATRARCALSEEQLLRFHSDGFLVVRKLLSTSEIMALSEHVDAIASGSVPGVPPEKVQPDPPDADVPPELGRTATTGVRKMYDLTLHDEEMLAHARHPAIVDVIEDLLGTPDLKLCA
eukprot:COSAG06_NODE_5479_length_3453_cov_2.172033_3_plen_189_part_00